MGEKETGGKADLRRGGRKREGTQQNKRVGEKERAILTFSKNSVRLLPYNMKNGAETGKSP